MGKKYKKVVVNGYHLFWVVLFIVVAGITTLGTYFKGGSFEDGFIMGFLFGVLWFVVFWTSKDLLEEYKVYWEEVK